VCYSAPSHRTKTVRAAGLSLIELPPAEPGLNPAERVSEELRRAVKREIYGTIEDKMAAVDRELTSVTGFHWRIRRLVG
jgi:transposase